MDLTNLSPEDLQALKAQLDALESTDGRSPNKPRQLHDLTLAPTKDDPRPTFFWSAERPRNDPGVYKTHPYPRLLWHGKTGEEITVHSAKAHAEKVAQGYVEVAPANAQAPDPAEAMRTALAALTPEDRKMLAEAAKKDRIARLQEQMAGLSDEDLDALMRSVEPSKKKTA